MSRYEFPVIFALSTLVSFFIFFACDFSAIVV